MNARAPDGRRDALDLIDPEEWNEERDRRARARAERRAQRREPRADPGGSLLGTPRALEGAGRAGREPWLGGLGILRVMLPRRDRLVVWAFGFVVAAWMVAEVLTGYQSGLLYLAPALVLALPLLLGRYLGEEQLVELAGRRPARPRQRVLRVAGPRSRVPVMRRGGRLVASGMAKRPPPWAALLCSAA